MRIEQSGQTSRRITDAQQGIHKNLERVVQKHFLKPHQKPIAEHTQLAFDAIKSTVVKYLANDKPLIFDSCCGTAMSTAIIAKKNPGALVIGIDRSAVRLAKEYNKEKPKNVLLVQAECADFWSLAQKEGWKLDKHFILYPNPYPKSKHLKRRWHGHPAFPLLFLLGGELTLRTNWKVYADEFCTAVGLGLDSVTDGVLSKPKGYVELIQSGEPLSLFEKKYAESGQSLYQCKIKL